MRRKGRVNMADIAREAGVSAATVSRVLSAKGNVSEDVSRNVLNAVDKLGYVRNLGAATLASSQSNTIGLFVRSMGNQFYGSVAAKVQEETDRAGYELLMGAGGDDINSQMKSARNLLGHGIDGMIIVSGRVAPEVISYAAKYVPTVVLAAGIDVPSVSSVRIDPQSEVDLATRVVSKGHKCVAVTASSNPLASTLHSRTSSFLTELVVRGVKTIIMPLQDFSDESVYEQLGTVISEGATAVMTGSDTIALSVLESLRKHGLSCPDDVSVTGFDGVGCLASPLLGITTVQQPVEALARNAVSIMERHLENDQIEVARLVLKGHFIVGNTLGNPKAVD